MSNTILAGNEDERGRLDPDASPDCYSPKPGQFRSNRDNLVGVLTDTCLLRDGTFGDTSFMMFGTIDAPLDPQLEPLNANGGSTRTHKLKGTSPAVDADLHNVGGVFFSCLPVDQRTKPRPQGGHCDIGAFELTQGIGGRQPGDLAPAPPQVRP